MTELPERPMPTVEAIWAALTKEAQARQAYLGFGISASALGQECDRAVWYSLTWASPPETVDGHKARIFERGDIEEQRVIRDLRKAGLTVHDVDPATGKQWAIRWADGWIRGKADGVVTGVIEAPKARHVLEVKSLKAADWRAIWRHGLAKAKPLHWHQLHAGMVGLSIDRGLYVGVNKDTDEILTERIHLDAELGARQEARILRLVKQTDAPLRINDKADSFACRFCAHNAVCHGGAFAVRSCRTCLHFTLTSDGNGHCSRFDEPRGPLAQKADCPAHLYLPDMVPGEQIDADESAETVTYRMADGSEWTDGLHEISTQEVTE